MDSRTAEIRAALAVFLGKDQVTELRAFAPDGKPLSGAFYRDLDLMASRAALLDREASGIYFVPNPLRADLVPPGRTHQRGNAKADCVASRRWLLIDSDPFRFGPDGARLSGTAAKVPSTEAERVAAWDLICGVRDLCEGMGAAGGVLGDSGNGFHLCYPLDLLTDQASYDLVGAILAGLESRLGGKSARAEIDQKTKDAPRVWKLYGTESRKGQASAERPYRYSRLIEGPAWDGATAQSNNAAFASLAAAWRMQDEAARPKQQQHSTNGVSVVERARKYLEKEEISVQGCKGSDPCFHVAGICTQGFLLSDTDALEAMSDWNARCQPPWSERELLHKLADARKAPCDKPFGYLLNAQPSPNGNHQPHHSSSKAQSQQKGATPPPDKLLIRASSVEPKSVRWLWPGRIPLGKMTTFAGQGGLGKTFVLLDVAARVTTGMAWPDGADNGEPGDVIFISGEDDADDTLVPRLIEMGADLSRVHFLTDEAQSAFHIGRTDLLEAFVQAAGGNVRLIVIDPPTSYLAGVDDHKNGELRQVLTPIKILAGRLSCAVVFNTHVNKGGAGKLDALARVMGSVAWVNAVRVACLFAKDPEDPTGVRRLFVGMKVNIGKERKGLAFRIAETTGDLARIEWLGEVSTTADQAVKGERVKTRGLVASEWLVEQFASRKEWPSDDLFRAAREQGISRSAMFEAKATLELPKPRKRVHSDGEVVWTWWVPDNWTPPRSRPQPAPVPPEEEASPTATRM